MTQEINEVTETDSPKLLVTEKTSTQPLLGVLLFWGLLLAFGMLIGGLIWGGYVSWNFTKNQAALPSISGLPQGSDAVSVPAVRIESPPIVVTEPEASDEVIAKAKATDIQVLNGGAAKGSAGTAAEILKKDGFSKVVSGNTVNNYTGVVIYYATNHESEADTVKKSLLKSYPKAETKPALKDNKETTGGTITVILGK